MLKDSSALRATERTNGAVVGELFHEKALHLLVDALNDLARFGHLSERVDGAGNVTCEVGAITASGDGIVLVVRNERRQRFDYLQTVDVSKENVALATYPVQSTLWVRWPAQARSLRTFTRR